LLLSLLAAATLALPSDGLPVKSPTAVGMSAERLEAIDRVVLRGLNAGGYPGASVVVGRKGAAVWEKGFGHIDWSPSSGNVTADRTIYDLASLSKVVGTTTAVMVLFDEGKLNLDDPVSKYVPEFSGGLKDQVTIRHLLTHRSGLPPGRDLWREANSPAEARALVIHTPLGCRPGACYEYSDLGADMLGFVVEAAAGMPLDKFLAAHVFEPLGMSDTFYKPADSLRARIAPTEVTPPRGYPLQGEVHDENAYALGGVAGHAGLFSTAADLSVFAQMMLNGGTYGGVRVIADSTVQMFTRREAGTRALGWDTCSGQGGCGSNLSERAFGHTGYTGTSIWIDPDREMFVVLLTNRVHAARAKRPAKVIADVRADLADAAAAAVMDDPDNLLAMPVSFRADRAEGWNTAERSASSRHVRSTRASRRARALAAKRAHGKASSKSSRASSSRGKSSSSASARVSTKSSSKASASKSSAKKSTAKASSKSSTKKPAAKKPAPKKRR
jgi:serine-type D-Ala-D-Ala carboxypeptidase